MQNSTIEFTNADQVLQVISSGNALVKTICSPIGDNQSWELLITQIADPRNCRIVREVDETKKDRSRVYIPSKDKWETRKVKNQRGAAKETPFTKKTATTLLPPDGVIKLFQPSDPNLASNIGLIFDVKYCDLKDGKYVFDSNKNTHARWWIKTRNRPEFLHKVSKSIPFSTLQAKLAETRKRKIIPEQNEILAGVSQQSVIGIFIAEAAIIHDPLAVRLHAIAKQEFIKKHLSKEVPIFIIDSLNHIKEYTIEEQNRDINRALQSPKNINPQALDIINKDISKEHRDSIILRAQQGENKEEKEGVINHEQLNSTTTQQNFLYIMQHSVHEYLNPEDRISLDIYLINNKINNKENKSFKKLLNFLVTSCIINKEEKEEFKNKGYKETVNIIILKIKKDIMILKEFNNYFELLDELLPHTLILEKNILKPFLFEILEDLLIKNHEKCSSLIFNIIKILAKNKLYSEESHKYIIIKSINYTKEMITNKILKNEISEIKLIKEIISLMIAMENKEINDLLKEILENLLESKKLENTEIICFMIESGIIPNIRFETNSIGTKKTIGYDEENVEWIYSNKCNYLTKFILHSKNDVLISTVITHCPHIIKYILQSLTDINQKIKKNTGGKFYYTLEKIQETQIKLLLAIKEEHQYQATFEDKRLLEDFLRKEIDQIQNPEQLSKFLEKYQNIYLLTQRRHYYIDTCREFFFGKNSPVRSQSYFEKIVNEKRQALIAPQAKVVEAETTTQNTNASITQEWLRVSLFR